MFKARINTFSKRCIHRRSRINPCLKDNNILIFLFALDTIYRILIGYVPCFQHNTNNNQQ